jgi:hypothetical protein
MRVIRFVAFGVTAFGVLTSLLNLGEVARRVGEKPARGPAPVAEVRAPAPPPPLPALTAKAQDDPMLFMARYGPPSEDRSTEKDVPRPRVVSRILTYRAERVRATYRVDSPFGASRSQRRWKLTGYTDPVLNEPLDAEEVERRMAGRGVPP